MIHVVTIGEVANRQNLQLSFLQTETFEYMYLDIETLGRTGEVHTGSYNSTNFLIEEKKNTLQCAV